MREFRKLLAWERAHALTLRVYAATEAFPQRESFGLTMHLRRSALVPPQRIAEACGRDLLADRLRALGIARAALIELEYLLLLAHDLELLKDDAYHGLQTELVETRRILSGYMRSLEREETSQP